jgi:hypothetical protein
MSDHLKDARPSSGTPELALQQRAFRTKIDYRFFRDYVEYTIRDRNGALSCFTVKYSALPGRTEYGAYQPARSPITGLQILLFALMILMISSAFPKASQWEIGLMVGGAVAALAVSIALRWRFRDAYTTIPTVKGKLHLLRNKQHDQVLQELESRRLKELRKLATIDTLNSPQAELRKFEWLKEQEIITQEEFELFRQKLNLASARLNFSGLMPKPPDEIVN